MNVTKKEIPIFGKAYALLNVSLIVVDQRLNIEYINATALDILKLEQNHDVLNQSFFNFWSDLKLMSFLNADGQVVMQKPIKIHDCFFQWERIEMLVDGEKKLFLAGKDVTEKELLHKSLEDACANILGLNFTERFTAPYYINEVYNYLNNIINKIPCYVYWKNRSLQYIGCNQMAADFVKFKSTSEIIGKTDYDLFDERLANEYRATDAHIFATGETVTNEPGTLVDEHGNVIHTLVSKIPIKNQKGDIMGLAGISVDVTELKNIQASAELAHRAKTEFIANMSHDIRTPLTGVVGMAKMLEDSLHDLNQKQYARWLGESGKQLLNMLNGILDVVSADQLNESDLHEESFNLHQIIYDIEQLERPSTLIKGLDLVIYVDEAIPSCLISDATKIHRILLNLLGNAIKFTQVGRVEINVALLERNNSHVVVQFCIKDTGIGIPKDVQDKVFDRFYRVTPSNKGIYTGHGVGLHIAQSYVDLLGGEIILTSELGIGTTFYFNLSLKIGIETLKMPPSRTTDSLHDRLLVLPMPESFVEIHATESLEPKLLLVEDNKIALFTLENLITQSGYRFVSVMDGDVAFYLAQAQTFDLIITDLGLPGLSGMDLTLKIRAFEKETQRKPIPIIGLTAHSEERVKRSCLQAGMNEVFTKPMTVEVLTRIKQVYFSSITQTSTMNELQQLRYSEAMDFNDAEDELFKLDSFTVFDAQSALIGMSGDINLLKNILRSIVEKETPADLLELESAHKVDDWQTIEKLAHRMKSGFVYCGALKLVHACQCIERYSKAGHSQLLEPLYQQLLLVIDETKKAVNEWLHRN
ncbi:MAG: ATP-binding protein [Legionella sp.]|nr:ATP-binding protein [Legionella sp.]